MNKSLITNIFIDSDDEIQEHIGDYDIMEYLHWYFMDKYRESTDDSELIKQLKLLIFDYEKVDIVLNDLEITYMEFIARLCRLFPSMMTPHISRQIRLRYDEFEFAGQLDPEPVTPPCEDDPADSTPPY